MKTCPLSELEQESAVELMKKYTTAAGKPKQCKKMLDHDTVQAQPTLLAWNEVLQGRRAAAIYASAVPGRRQVRKAMHCEFSCYYFPRRLSTELCAGSTLESSVFCLTVWTYE